MPLVLFIVKPKHKVNFTVQYTVHSKDLLFYVEHLKTKLH